MGASTVAQLLFDAEARQQFANDMALLQKRADVLFPGSKIHLITSEETKPATLGSITPAFEKMTIAEQIAHVLFDAGEPITKDELLTRLNQRGSKVTDGTLLTYLSKGKGKDFHRIRRGLWTHRHLLPREPNLGAY